MTRTYTSRETGTTLFYSHALGKGAFGTAVAVKDRKGDLYCLKEITFRAADEEAKKNAITEVKLMKETCDHPNIVTFYESWFERNRMCILMEYAPNASLDKLLAEYASRGKKLPVKKVSHFVEELADALRYCHVDLRILHRDLKPANILIDKLGSLKLADFGLSKSLEAAHDLASTFCGSPLFMAPELCSGKVYSYPADMWALGCVLFEIMALRSPWESGDDVPRTIPALMRHIVDGKPNYSLLSKEYPERLVNTVKWLLQKKVEKRATASEIVDLLEMRAPPTLAQTIRCESELEPLQEGWEEEAKTRPSSVEEVDTPTDRCARIVRDAAKLANAACVLQRSFRRSVERRRLAGIPRNPAPSPLPFANRAPSSPGLDLFDRPPIAVTGLPKKPVPRRKAATPSPPSPAKQKDSFDTSIKVLQKAVRNSLNRRRRDHNSPPVASTRIQQLALPRTRTPRYSAVPPPLPPVGKSPHQPPVRKTGKPAWV